MKDENKTKVELIKELKFLREEREKGVFKDITKQTEQVIQESEARFKELFNHMSSGVAVYEAKDNGKDFIIKDINRAAEKIEKVKKEDIIGKSVLKVFPGVKDFGLFKVFQEVYRTGKPQHHPISLYEDQRIAGWRENYVYKLPSGEIAAVYDDITKRKQAEEELKIISERLELAMDAGEHGFWDWNLDTDDTYFSPRYYTMLGYKPGELPMRKETWAGLMHPEDRKIIVPKVEKYVKNAEPYEVEFRLKTKDGDWKWISGRGKSYNIDKM